MGSPYDSEAKLSMLAAFRVAEGDPPPLAGGRYTKDARFALEVYIGLVHLIRRLTPRDARSFRRAVRDLAEGLQYETGPLAKRVGVGKNDIRLDHDTMVDGLLCLLHHVHNLPEADFQSILEEEA